MPTGTIKVTLEITKGLSQTTAPFFCGGCNKLFSVIQQMLANNQEVVHNSLIDGNQVKISVEMVK